MMKYQFCVIVLFAAALYVNAEITGTCDLQNTKLETTNLAGTDVFQLESVTKYPPRPTTSAPQWYLRSLCTSPRGKFPHPLDCHKYLDCWDGRVLEKLCPNDLVFSDLGDYCDYLENVDCGSRPVLPTIDVHYELKPSSFVPPFSRDGQNKRVALSEESLTIIRNEPSTKQDLNDDETNPAKRRQVQKIIRRRLQ